jgi:hypothetical protein
LIVEAVERLNARSCLLDCEAVACVMTDCRHSIADIGARRRATFYSPSTSPSSTGETCAAMRLRSGVAPRSLRKARLGSS